MQQELPVSTHTNLDKATTNQQQELLKDNQESDWSLSSVEPVPISSIVEQDQLDDGNLSKTLNEEYSSYITKNPPEKPKLKKETMFNKIGKIQTFVGQFMIVKATDPMILDLDNYVFDKQRRLLGYVVDVLGPVSQPYYSIKLEKVQLISTLQIDQAIYFSQGSRLLSKQDIEILKKKGKLDEVQQSDDSESNQQQVTDKKKSYKKVQTQVTNKRKREFKTQQKQFHQQNFKRPYNNQQYPSQQQQYTPVIPNLTPQQNKQYLENMYQQYYNQMMYFYSNQK